MLARLTQLIFSAPSEPAAQRYQTTFECSAPCQGEAFSFRVTITELWAYPGDFPALEIAVRNQIETQHLVLGRRIRLISRRFPPEKTAEFEAAANTELESSARFPEHPSLTCEFLVRAEVDADLKEHLRESQINRLKAQAEFVSMNHRLHHLGIMRNRWLDFLRQLGEDPLASLAARLAENPALLAGLLEKHALERQRLTDELRGLCDTITAAYLDKDAFEFVTGTESALTRLLHYIGIDGTPGQDGTEPADRT